MIKNLQLYLIAALFILGAVVSLLVHRNNILKADNLRQTANMASITNEHNRQLTLTSEEYTHLQGQYKTSLDSVLLVTKIKLRHVAQATIIRTIYRDTTITRIEYRPAQKQPDGSYMVPVSFNSPCWGITGDIATTDPKALLTISDKRAANGLQLIVTRERFFLGLLWRTRPATYTARSDCGTVAITHIDFKK